MLVESEIGALQTRVRMTPSGSIAPRYPQLALIRGIAACVVAGGHWRCLFFQDYDGVPSPGILCKLFYFLTGFGHQAVIVLFVLSGFVICNAIHANVRKGVWSFREYLAARLTRLWVVLIPALILGDLFDSIGASTLHGGGYLSIRWLRAYPYWGGSRPCWFERPFRKLALFANHNRPNPWFRWTALESCKRVLVLRRFPALPNGFSI